MPPLVDAEHFLDLRFRLEREVLRRSAAHDHDRALAAAALCVEHDARRLVHVAVRVDRARITFELQRGDVHPDARIAGRRGVDRNTAPMRRAQQRLAADAQHALAFGDVLAAQPVELGARHRALELVRPDDLPKKGVRGKQDVVVEENVVDAHDALLSQHDVALGRVSPVHGEAETEVRVVIQVGARGDDPVDEPGLDEWNEATHAESGRRECPGERETDGDIALEHLVGEQVTSLAQPARVVRLERPFDELDDRLPAVDAARVDLPAAQEPAGRDHVVLRACRLARLGGQLLHGFRSRRAGARARARA